MSLRRVLWWTAIILLVWWAIDHPQDAANGVKSIMAMLQHAALGLQRFGSAL